MARKTGDDYIPTYGDIEAKRAEADQRAQEARSRGYHLGEYEITYRVSGLGTQLTEKVAASSKAEALELLKKNCGMVGWWPEIIDTKTLVEPNVYV